MKQTTRRFIKKAKANFIRFKLHRIFGSVSKYIIFLGYLSRLSKWVDQNKKEFVFDDFYNKKVVHGERVGLYEFLLRSENLSEEQIDYLEFGVGRGRSMEWWTSHNNHSGSRFHGFDTFEGLPEDWGGYKEGAFAPEGNFPAIEDKRLKFYKGLFQETLTSTLKEMDLRGKRKLIHMDGDMYSSALFPLAMLYPYLNKGDLIIFDEFVVPLDEFRAFEDFTKSFYIKLKPLGAINNYLQVAFKII